MRSVNSFEENKETCHTCQFTRLLAPPTLPVFQGKNEKWHHDTENLHETSISKTDYFVLGLEMEVENFRFLMCISSMVGTVIG